MAKFVIFNGITYVHPGGGSKVDVNSMAQVGLGVSGIVGLIGEADGGESGSLIIFDDPANAKSVFKSGPLADAVRLCFEPSSDNRVPGGAFRVVCYKVNEGKQAEITLMGRDEGGVNCALDNQVLIQSQDYGSHTTQIGFAFEDDAVNTQQFTTTTVFESIKEIGSNIAGKPLMGLAYKGPEEELYSVTSQTTTGNGNGGGTTLEINPLSASIEAGQWVKITAAPGTNVDTAPDPFPGGTGPFDLDNTAYDAVINRDFIITTTPTSGIANAPDTVNIEAAPAIMTAAAPEPYDIRAGDTITVSVDGGANQAVTFTAAAAPGPPALMTAVELAGQLGSLLGVYTGIDGAGTSTRVITEGKGTDFSIEVIGGDARAVVVFPIATYSPAGTNDVADASAVTATELKTIVAADTGGDPSVTYVEVDDSGGPISLSYEGDGTTNVGAASAMVLAEGAADATLLALGLVAWTENGGQVVVANNPIVEEYRQIDTAVGTTITVLDAFTDQVPTGTIFSVSYGRFFEGTISSATANTAVINNYTVGATGSDLVITNTALDNMLIRIDSGNGQGQYRKIASSTYAVGPPQVVTVTLASGEEWDVIPSAADQISLVDVTAATATITGASGAATNLSTTITYGASWPGVVAPAPAADLNITLDSTMSVNSLVSQVTQNSVLSPVSAGSEYAVRLGLGRAGTAAGSAQWFDFDGNNTTVDLMADFNVLPYTKSRLNDDLNQLITEVNATSGLITMTRSDTTAVNASLTGAGVPLAISDTSPVNLTYPAGVTDAAGMRGNSSNSNWQTGFDELLKTRINTVVPLISENLTLPSTATRDSVHAQLASHVDTASGVGKNERNAYASIKEDSGSSTLTNILNRASVFNNSNVSLVYQSPTVLNVDGDLIEQDPWAHACLAAGMQAGTEVGTPSTFKYIKTNGVNNNSNYADPADRTISNQLLLGGVMFTEYIKGKGHRWVRGLTTHLTDDNLALTDVSVKEVLNYVSYDLRTKIENKFTGEKALPANVGSIKTFLNAQCEVYRTNGIIVDSQDEETGELLKAYNGIKVTVSGDIATIKLNIFPVTGINYELLNIFAQLPFISA